MALHPFRLDDLPATPWRNGGGVTREVVSMPNGAGFEEFDWRVSVATIAADGPFSAFPGIDRTIMLLDGDGVRLRAGAGSGSLDHTLAEPLVPYAFSGDLALDCTLLGGRSTDLNLMVRRGRGRGVLAVHRGHVTAAAPAGLVIALGGDVDLDGSRAGVPDRSGVWWDEPTSLEIRCADAGSGVAVVTWTPAG